MTTNDFRSAEDLHDEQIVEGLLTESGMDHPADTGELKPALMHVRSIAHGPQPTPRGEFAALLARLDAGPTAAPGTGTVASLEDRRRKRRTRLVIAATALSLTVGAGAAAAAVNPDFRDTVQKTVTTLINTLTSAPDDRSPGTPKPLSTPAPTTASPGQPAAPGSTAPRDPTTPTVPAYPKPDGTMPDPGDPGIGHPAPAEPSFVPPAVPGRNASPVPAPAPSRPAAPTGSTPQPVPATGGPTTQHPGRP
ncbi:MAG: hypothetical protein NVSMB43_06440 [Pseudarthrobacter sp.]